MAGSDAAPCDQVRIFAILVAAAVPLIVGGGFWIKP